MSWRIELEDLIWEFHNLIEFGKKESRADWRYIGDPGNERHEDYRKEQAGIEEEDQGNQPDYGEF